MKDQAKAFPFAVLIGDIKHSRNIPNRAQVQKQFTIVLQEINEKYVHDLASKFMITLGDSFQGLLKNKASLVKIIFEIEMAMDPIELRFGIGLGDISTEIQWENSMEIDGTAYHRARQMVEEVEMKESQYTKNETNIMLCSSKENLQMDRLLNTVFSLATALKSKWSIRQKEIIFAYYKSEENQYQAAEALGIAQSSVNKALKTSKYYTYQQALEEISEFFSHSEKVGE